MGSPLDSIRFTRRCLMLAGIVGGVGVLLGAFGAHGMPTYLASRDLPNELITKRLDQFDVGIRYHLLHAIALLALPVAASCLSIRSLRIVAGLWVLGILLFSGSLYLLVLLNQSSWGMVTPLGGLSLIVAWTWLAIAAILPTGEPQS